MSGQSKRMSAVETLASTAIGFIIAFVAQIWIMEQFGIECDFGRDLVITVFFTVISLLRGYFVRRLFNWLGERT